MNIGEEVIVPNLPWIIAGGLLLGLLAILGWMFTTWLRVKNGYPLEGMWGQAIHPRSDQDQVDRMRLLTSENAQLRAELGSVKDRLATVERIVTDGSYRLDREIEQLRGTAN
jgi:hypothetical protein